MKNIILATHGFFAEGIKSSLEIIYGKINNLYTISAYTDKNQSINEQIENVLNKLDSDSDTIVITDIFGGSVNNEFIPYIESHSIFLIAGLNLPLLIELVSRIDYEKDTEVLIKDVVEASKESIQYCNTTILNCLSDDDEF